jgi:hypothetical protein
MKVLKVITIASAFCLALAGICLANPVFPDGNVSASSTIDSFTAVTGLDFDNDGTFTTMATIMVSNNYEKAWDLQLDFANDGVFKRHSVTNGDGIAVVSGTGAEIPMTAIRFHPTGTGTLGSGLTAPGTITLSGSGPASYKYECGGTQSTATVGYEMDIQCSWHTSTALLQGTYRESITATLTIGDGD